MARRRYQRGALRKEGQYWILRWREDVISKLGAIDRVERRARIGAIKDLPTKALARRASDHMLDHVNSSDYRPGKVITMKDFAPLYESDGTIEFKPSAKKTVRTLSKSYIVPYLGTYRMDEIGGQVPQFMVKAMHMRGLSRKTIKNAVSQLASMLKWARECKYMAAKLDWDMIHLPAEEDEKEVRCFTPDEAQRIIEAALEPWNLCFAIMAYLGIRAGEAMGLTWGHVDFQGALLRIRQSAWEGKIQTLKSKQSRRDLPLPDALAAMLADYLGRWVPNDAGLLFATQKGLPARGQYVRRKILHPLRERLGIPRGAFHAFRHGHATIMFSEGANPKTVMDSMGHSDIKTTMRYTHAISNDRREAVERATQVFLRRSAANADGKSLQIQ